PRKQWPKDWVTAGRAKAILQTVVTPFHLFDRLGQMAVQWCKATRKWTGLEIDQCLRLALPLALALALAFAAPVVLKVCVDRVRALSTLPCWQEKENGGNGLVNTPGASIGNPGEPREWRKTKE